MAYSLEAIQCAMAIAVSGQLTGKSERFRKLYRRKTAAWLDDCFFDILSNLNVKHFIECGAHEASASVRFIRAGGTRALAIEANPVTFATKTASAGRVDGVVAINCGVGEEPGEADFFIPQSNSADGSASFLQKEGQEYSSRRIRIETLDVLHRDNFTSDEPSALWIDVEGMGLQVLKGGTSLLRNPNCLAIKIEVESIQFWSGQSLVDQLNEFLNGLGFVPVLRDIEYPGQFNVLYVRSAKAALLDEVILQSWIKLQGVRIDWPEKAGLLKRRSRKWLGKRLG
jgi:FkbM family methyltransferase